MNIQIRYNIEENDYEVWVNDDLISCHKDLEIQKKLVRSIEKHNNDDIILQAII